MKKLIWGIALVAAFVGGILISNNFNLLNYKQHVHEEAQVLLSRIEKVSKLVTVDGYFSEVYDYKDYYGYDWKIFRKKALIRVKAKVSVGYDLENISVEVDESSRTISIGGLPEPTILSIDHDLDYYDLSEGTFNSFSTADLTKLQDQAKSYIAVKAENSDLINQAEERGQEILQSIAWMVESHGWNLTVHEKEIVENERD